jgi:hypothetical protein
MSKIKTLVALAVLGATTFPIAGGALVRPVQARPRNNGGLGSIIIGGALGYGIYAANKHHRQDDRRNSYGNYGGYNNGYGNGRTNRPEPEHHEGYGYGNNGYGGYSGGYNNGGYNNGYGARDSHHDDYDHHRR